MKHTLPLWQVTHDWFGLNGIKINKSFCKSELLSHPDYPALTSVTDFLDSGNMHYQAVQADASYIHEFNYPLLAHIKEPGNEWLHIIASSTDWEKQKDVTQHWSGVCIYSEKDSSWFNKENETYRKEKNANNLQSLLAVAIALTLFILTVLNNLTPSFIIFGLLSLVGLVISILATGTELGVQSNLVKQVCGAISNGGCDKVLKSNYAKGFAGFTTGDMATLYFAAQFITLLCTPIYPALFDVIILISLPGILVAGWSIYTQALKIKQWCPLCLVVATVLVLQFLISTYLFASGYESLARPNALFIYIGIAFVLGLCLMPLKSLLKTNEVNQQKLVELKKWKMDVGLFLAQWQNEQQVDNTVWENDLLIGPCARAHHELDEMLEKHKTKLCVQIRLLCNSKDEGDIRTIAVKAILGKATELNNTKQKLQMLSDWFATMNYERWITKWNSSNSTDVQTMLQRHEAWIEQSNIAFTPTFFVNGKKLPGRYGLKELGVLLPQLTASLTNELTT